MNGNPIFLSSNYLRLSTAIITVSTGSSSKSKLYDRDKNTQWSSVGSNDTITESIEVDFGVSKQIDTLLLQNINLKNFKLQYWTGSAWADVTGVAETTWANNYYYKEFTAITTQKVKLLMYSTQTANQEKKVGEMWVMLKKYEIPDPNTFKFKPENIEINGYYRLGDGTQESWYIKSKWSNKIPFEYLSQSVTDSLKSIYDEHSAFTIYPEPIEKPSECYEVNWTSKWNAYYVDTIKGNGYNLDMNVEEI